MFRSAIGPENCYGMYYPGPLEGSDVEGERFNRTAGGHEITLKKLIQPVDLLLIQTNYIYLLYRSNARDDSIIPMLTCEKKME